MLRIIYKFIYIICVSTRTHFFVLKTRPSKKFNIGKVPCARLYTRYIRTYIYRGAGDDGVGGGGGGCGLLRVGYENER